MLAPFHLGKRDSGSKNIISINKLTNLFIKVIKNFLRLSPAGLCFPSLPTCSASCHYPAFSFSVIIRLDRIIHAAEHHFPSSAASPALTRRVRLDRGIFNLDCPIKSGNDIKEIKSGNKEANRAAAKKEETTPLKRKHPFAQTFRSSRNVTEKRKDRNITKKVNAGMPLKK